MSPSSRKPIMHPASAFLGKCPECQSYDTRIRSQVINYDQTSTDRAKVASISRVFSCNSCGHDWLEKVGDDDQDQGPPTPVI
jgi:hypothetical protein